MLEQCASKILPCVALADIIRDWTLDRLTLPPFLVLVAYLVYE